MDEEYDLDDYGLDDEFEYDFNNEEIEECLPVLEEAEPGYKVLTTMDMLRQQESDIKKIKEVLNISSPFARVLLMFFQWNVEQLLEIFFSKGKSQVYKRAGLVMERKKQQVVMKEEEEEEIFDCPICMDETDFQDTTSLTCNHRFCNTCWQGYISLQVKEGNSKNLSCMANGCQVKFDQTKIVQFLDDEQMEKHAKKMLESYVEDNARVVWCPSVPHCGNAIMLKPSELTTVEVTCTCGKQFCFQCLEPPHSPCTCRMVKLWQNRSEDKRKNDDILSARMASMNIRECPHCSARVERVSGCNLMTCRCGNYFCWLCGEKTGFNHTWEKIEGHECGRYKAKSLKELTGDDSYEELPEELVQRFEFYERRHIAHLESAKLEKNLIQLSKQKIVRLMQSNAEFCPEIYLHWIRHALEKLFTSRQILTWSYIFCFCLLEKEFSLGRPRAEILLHKGLFEDFQQQLESSLERLSKELEAPVEAANVDACKRLLARTVDVDKRCQGLYDIVEKSFGAAAGIEWKISGYVRTTEGVSTLLAVEPRNAAMNFLEEIRGGKGFGDRGGEGDVDAVTKAMKKSLLQVSRGKKKRGSKTVTPTKKKSSKTGSITKKEGELKKTSRRSLVTDGTTTKHKSKSSTKRKTTKKKVSTEKGEVKKTDV